MKTTKKVNVSIVLCDDCKKNQTKHKCEGCCKDLCDSCSAYKLSYEIPLICKDCFNILPKFAQGNMESILTCEDDEPFHPDYYKREGFYIFVVTHEDGGNVHYCKDEKKVIEILDEYNTSDNEDEISYVYDEKGNKYDINRSAKLDEVK